MGDSGHQLPSVGKGSTYLLTRPAVLGMSLLARGMDPNCCSKIAEAHLALK